MLRQALEAEGSSLKDLTVLSAHRDPFRLRYSRSTRRQWFAGDRCAPRWARKIHLRGCTVADSAVQAQSAAATPVGRKRCG
jgi:hypothetical protein